MKFKDFCIFKEGYVNPSQKIASYFDGPIKWLRATDLKNSYVYNTSRTLSEEGFKSAGKSSILFKPDTIAISKSGTIGRIGILKDYMCGNRAIINIEVNQEKMNLRYVFYWLMNEQNYIQNLAVGSVQKNLYISVLEQLEIVDRPLQEQKAIADILSALDDEIELNHQINQDLEEMAQAIFKSWFVDFEPFRDGEFVDSELGPIPKGWEVKNFGSLVEILIGGDWGKSEPEKNYNQQVYCIRGADIPEINLGRDGKVPIRYILKKNLQKKISGEGDLIVEISGGSPTQSTGRVAIVTRALIERFSNKLICTNFCRLIRPKNDKFSYFIYYYWKYLYAKDVFFIYENGTTGIKNLDISGFLKTFKIIVPPEEKIQEFNGLIKDKLSFIQKNGEENQILSNLRDTLLPKLMSGEIRV